MNSTQISPAAARPSAETRAAGRWFCLVAAVVALGGSLWAARGDGCAACHAAAARLSGLPLAWIGVVFYGSLALAVVWKGVSPWTRGAFLAACGTHAALVGLMAEEQIFCVGCALAAAAALLGAGASLLPRRRALIGLVIACAGVALLSFAALRVQRSLEAPAESSTSGASLSPAVH